MTQKFLKQIPDSSGCIPTPKAQVLRRGPRRLEAVPGGER